MRASKWFLSTLKEIPAEAELVSHRLMLRAGLIRKLGSGLYTWMPLGLRVLRKIEAIVREEMDLAGGMEVLMPAIQPAELWKETQRWETFGGLLLTMVDSSDREYCYGPTHEEVITDVVRNVIHSYKQLPANFYQIQTKFRDEIRPRFGVMRAREFIMKDAYSFHLNRESLQATYEKMYQTYCRIFDRLGLRYRAVEADTGAIGGYASHEFQVLADSGEDLIFYSDTSSYAANIEQATSLCPQKVESSVDIGNLSLVDTPQQKTIIDVARHLNLPTGQLIKTLIVEGKDEALVALILAGDDELNEIKAVKHPKVKSPLTFADEAQIQKILGSPSGFLGPVKMTIPIIVDNHAAAMVSFACGANQKDKHYINAVWGRDAVYQENYDLRNVKEGDLSPDGQGRLKSCRAIEVGHVFQLGDKYAKAMSAQVINEHGKLQTLEMGCYGIGVSRLVAAAIEQYHDDKGIIWPTTIAPFFLVIIPVNAHRSTKVKETAEQIYKELSALGLDILLDDRDERPGVLFADSELIGIPHRIVVSERLIENHEVEYKARTGDLLEQIKISELRDFVKGLTSS